MVRFRRALVVLTLVAATLALTPVHVFAQADLWSSVPNGTVPPTGAPANTTTTITGTVFAVGSLVPLKGVRVTLLFNNGGKQFHRNQITKSDGTYNFRNIKAHTAPGVYRYVVSFEKAGFTPRTFRWDNPAKNPTTGPAADGKFIMLRPGQACPPGQAVFCGFGGEETIGTVR